MTNSQSVDRLLFADLLPALRGASQQPWVVGNGVWEEEGERRCHSSALIPQAYVATSLKNPEDLETQMGKDGPTVWTSGKGEHTYHRTGHSHGIESVVIARSFSGIRPVSIELLEEYRLFHNLFFDASSGAYVRFDSAGDPEEIAKIDGTRARLLLRPLRQFLSWREASLALYIVCNRYEKQSLKKLGLKQTRHEIMQDDTSIFSRTIVNCDFKDGFETFSRLVGKVIIEPLPKEQSGWGPYKDEPNYASFVVGVDSNGAKIEWSCAPDVSEYHFLTPVWFRSIVLKKYQDDPDRYSVVDGLLSCVGLWDLPIDNDHEKFVVVFLGDLRSIPEADQFYWKAHNIPPAGRLSDTAVRRSLYGEWALSASPEHKFASAYMEFMKFSEQALGLFVIRPLNDGDGHCLKTLHVPHTENAMEFDQEVLKLTKLLVDSINDSELDRHIVAIKDEKSLSKLERYLVAKGRTDHAPYIGFLRRLQRYRSTNAAHRRGSDAKKAFDALANGTSSRRETLNALLCSAIDFLDYLTAVNTPATPTAGTPSPASGA